jgi:hypothetical protein
MTTQKRKPTDIVQLKLRFPEELRKKVEREANKNERSLNGEIVHRLRLTFQMADIQTIIKATIEAAIDGKLTQSFEEPSR